MEDKLTGNEPNAKAILPEPRSVQKANAYQFSASAVTLMRQSGTAAPLVNQ